MAIALRDKELLILSILRAGICAKFRPGALPMFGDLGFLARSYGIELNGNDFFKDVKILKPSERDGMNGSLDILFGDNDQVNMVRTCKEQALRWWPQYKSFVEKRGHRHDENDIIRYSAIPSWVFAQNRDLSSDREFEKYVKNAYNILTRGDSMLSPGNSVSIEEIKLNLTLMGCMCTS